MPRSFPLLWLSLLSGMLASVCSADSKTAFTLFEAVRDRPGVVFAPAALDDVLSLLYFGSAGETEAAFQSRLFPKLSRAEARTQAAKVTRTFPGYRSIGSLWADTRLILTDEFQAAASQSWSIPIARAPLQTDTTSSAKIINGWFFKKTNGHVPNVITPTGLGTGPDLVVVTVAAFASAWKERYFMEHETRPEYFYSTPDSKALVPTMKSVNSVPYGENEMFQTVRLDFDSGGLALLLLLPKKAAALDQALAACTPDVFSKSVAGLKSTYVNLRLPRIRYSHKIEWREPLAKLGLDIAFTNKADFSRINANTPLPLRLAQVMQEVRIQWDENGAEARAVTFVSSDPFGASSPPEAPVQFIANHPFVYLIFNTTTLDIYFMGVVSEPSQMSPTS
ncbi:MAG: serpin family protein [Opitutaceae bacterium]